MSHNQLIILSRHIPIVKKSLRKKIAGIQTTKVNGVSVSTLSLLVVKEDQLANIPYSLITKTGNKVECIHRRIIGINEFKVTRGI